MVVSKVVIAYRKKMVDFKTIYLGLKRSFLYLHIKYQMQSYGTLSSAGVFLDLEKVDSGSFIIKDKYNFFYYSTSSISSELI